MGNLIPADVDIVKSCRTFLDICLKINEGEIVLPPDEENEEIMSVYIESIMLLVPVAPVCMYYDKVNRNDENKQYVFVGNRMLKAVHMFMDGKFKLKGMKYFNEYEGCDYASLPARYRRRLSVCYVDIYVLRYGMPKETKMDLIERMSFIFNSK